MPTSDADTLILAAIVFAVLGVTAAACVLVGVGLLMWAIAFYSAGRV